MPPPPPTPLPNFPSSHKSLFMDHLVYVCCRCTTLVRALARSLARLLACGTQSVLSGKENLCFSPQRDETGLRDNATMIKGKQTGAGTEHNEIIRDVVVVAVVVVVFVFSLLFPPLSPPASRWQCASIFRIETPSQVRTRAGDALVIQTWRINLLLASRDHPPSRPRSGCSGAIG